MIQACFSNPNAPSNTTTQQNQMPQSLITCIYQTRISNSQTHLTLTWSKSLFSHSLTIHAPDLFSITLSLYPSTFSLFRTPKKGSKSIYLTHHHYQKIKLYWDFTRAEFTRPNSAEPDSAFYIAVVCNSRLEFFAGDLRDELTRRAGLPVIRYSAESTQLARREHVFGRRSYVTRAEFLGSKHEIEIECGGGVLRVKVDGAIVLLVKRLGWKFRGNERIVIGGVEVVFYWDVFDWVNNNGGPNKSGGGLGLGVFVFQVGDGGPTWPEMVGPEKRLMKKGLSAAGPAAGQLSPTSPSSSSVLQWAEESGSEGGRSSSTSSSSTRSCGIGGGGSGSGFSFLLYAWKKE